MFEFQAEVYIGLNVEMIEGREEGVETGSYLLHRGRHSCGLIPD